MNRKYSVVYWYGLIEGIALKAREEVSLTSEEIIKLTEKCVTS